MTSFLGAQAAIKQRKILIWHIREFMEEDLGIESVSYTHLTLPTKLEV
ncbi:hypothetical protein PVA38_11020 [Streptococcus pneumoniae D39]|nr:hypothetical protein PVA38_11020 [Streptococcus pneumoniae D39]